MFLIAIAVHTVDLKDVKKVDDEDSVVEQDSRKSSFAASTSPISSR